MARLYVLLLLLPCSLWGQSSASQLEAFRQQLERSSRRIALDSFQQAFQEAQARLNTAEQQAKAAAIWARYYNLQGASEQAWQEASKAIKAIPSDWRTYVQLEQGTAALRLGELDTAKILLQSSLEVFKASGERNRIWLRAQLSLAYQRQLANAPEQALDLLEELENYFQQIPHTFYLQQRYFDLKGHCLNQLGKVQQGIVSYKKGLDLISQEASVDSLALTRAYANIGIRYAELRDYTLANNYLQRALQLHQILGLSAASAANLHVTLGSLATEQQRMDEAEEHYQQALQLLPNPQLQDEWASWVRIVVLQGYAQHLSFQERHDEAIGLLKEAVQRSAYVPQTRGRNYSLLSNIYQAKEQLDSALYYTKRSIEESLTFRNQRSEAAYKYSRLAYLYFLQNRSDEALAACAKAEELLGLNNQNERRILNLQENPDLSSSLHLLHIKGQVLEQQGKPKEALRSLRESIEVAEYYRKSLVDKASKSTAVLNNVRAVFSDALRLSLTLAQRYPEQNYLEQSFEFAERSKANLLSDELQLQQARLAKSLPEDLVQREQELNKEVADLRQQKRLLEKPTEVAELQEQLLQKEKELRDLQNLFEQEYSDYYRLRYETQLPDLAALQKALPQEGLWLNYVLTDSLNMLLAVHKEGIEAHLLPTSEQLEPLIRSLYAAISQQESYRANPKAALAHFQHYSHSLYRILLGPLGEDLGQYKRLFISADGALHYLPFEVLISNSTAATSFAELPYLLHSHSISYQYLSKLFHNPKEAPRQALSILALAPQYADSSWLGPLPGAQAEVRWLEQTFEGDFLIGTEANKQRFEAAYAQHQIIHLAMHALVDNQEAQQSGLYFAADSGAVLRAFEIPFLKGNNELLVLGACETGYGPLQQGEGLVSLGQHFLYGGSHSLVLSLWKLSDNAQLRITQYFYEYLAQGKAKDIALQQAKQRYLAEVPARQAHPFFWASTIQLGTPRPLQLETAEGSSWLYGLALALGLLLIGIIVWKRRTS